MSRLNRSLCQGLVFSGGTVGVACGSGLNSDSRPNEKEAVMRTGMLLFVLWISSPGLAQNPQNSWENLKGLRPGQRIQVIRMDLSSIKGTFSGVTDEALTLQVGADDKTVDRPDVLRVSDREHPRRGRTALIGAAVVGGIVAVPAGLLWAICSNETTGCAAGPIGAIAAGAGAGAGLGALSPSLPTIYRAKRLRRTTKP